MSEDKPGFLRSVFRITDLEDELEEGKLAPSEFKEKIRGVYRFSENERFIHSVLVATLHYPLKTAFYVFWVPLSALFLLSFSNTRTTVIVLFVFYFFIRMLLGFYESWMFLATKNEKFTFNMGIWSTGLGTMPYRYNWLVGPTVASLMDIVIYLPFIFLPDFSITVFGFHINLAVDVANLAMMQTILGTIARMGLNLMAMAELPLLNNIEYKVSARTRFYLALGMFSNSYADAAVTYPGIIESMNGCYEGECWDNALEEAGKHETGAAKILKRALYKTRYENTLIETVALNLGE